MTWLILYFFPPKVLRLYLAEAFLVERIPKHFRGVFLLLCIFSYSMRMLLGLLVYSCKVSRVVVAERDTAE